MIPLWDAAEAKTLYERLENEIIPEFYTRNDKGHARCLGGTDARKHELFDTPILC